ncbi:LysR family transcriptional regulator [Polyangium spumosum]|uniref:LysR family transcriptional regulator n=1 Tax=Polyangium spumosum TaxID=889282 RepID=A0A6N7PLZ5_9BACT|nr:LysR family transcriptional regulator [Polyangium spumosum]MRG93038.1 LysR family transcriptional regulator [Polyangium spumosum]
MTTFVRVIDGGSLSAAARAQRLSLPAVSRQLRALEAELGAALLVRSTRRLRVTDAGQRWYEHCVRVLRDIDDGREAVRSTQSARGTLVVSTSLTYGALVVIPRLRRLAEEHPQLVVDLRLEDQLVDLVGEGVDVAVRAGSPPPDSTAYIAQPLATMARVLVAAPKWLRKNGTPRTPLELARFDHLVQVTPAGSVVRWRLLREREEETPDVRARIRSNAPLALRDLALDGAGIAYLPDWLVETEIAQGRLRRVLPEWSSPPITAYAIYRAELRGAPRVQAFVNALARDGAPRATKIESRS